ncbi:aspartate ammonia-lyase [Microbacterium halophytorum]|uniref:aspartate ammonia-lyase n=1 Tax=Microbacterium halophytorum TaxID=2067568 RepID=UPI000CFB55BC|nr:aspartate ammonia-lyase [Microbacterium halophytorum]
MTAQTRTETDSLGPLEIPADAYWGVHTARAIENFDITKRPISVYTELVTGLAMVKQAAARANRDIGAIDAERADLIDRAAQRVIDGEFHDQFCVGVIQGGAGTSTNMNANEVITNIALELAGREKGDYAFLHPIDHTNRSQSTNDVYPTAIKVGLSLIHVSLLDELELLRESFMRKAEEFADVLKVGRTQLQDAVPMTLGQEFHGFATTVGEDISRLRENAVLLTEISMGATAIGTGVTAKPGYAERVRMHLSEITGLPLRTAGDLVEATSDMGSFISFSASLKRNAVKVSKICNDLRLLSSGPQAGFGEINLPAKQAGSSIMPGKVNPVIPEVVNQIAYSVVGADLTVTMAAEAGQLQLNAFEPVIAHSILQSITWMRRGYHTLRVNCIDGITANRDRLGAMVGASVGVITALTPFIGYADAAALAKTALLTGRGIEELVVEAGLMTPEAVAKQLRPERLSGIEPITTTMPIVTQPDLP